MIATKLSEMTLFVIIISKISERINESKIVTPLIVFYTKIFFGSNIIKIIVWI